MANVMPNSPVSQYTKERVYRWIKGLGDCKHSKYYSAQYLTPTELFTLATHHQITSDTSFCKVLSGRFNKPDFEAVRAKFKAENPNSRTILYPNTQDNRDLTIELYLNHHKKIEPTYGTCQDYNVGFPCVDPRFRPIEHLEAPLRDDENELEFVPTQQSQGSDLHLDSFYGFGDYQVYSFRKKILDLHKIACENRYPGFESRDRDEQEKIRREIYGDSYNAARVFFTEQNIKFPDPGLNSGERTFMDKIQNAGLIFELYRFLALKHFPSQVQENDDNVMF